MINNHIFEVAIDEIEYIIRHNAYQEICLIWYDEISRQCAFGDNIPDELKTLINEEGMNRFYVEDYYVLAQLEIVNKLKKPYVKIKDHVLYDKAREKHSMTTNEYAIFLGYAGYITTVNNCLAIKQRQEISRYYPYIRDLFKGMEGTNGFRLDTLSLQIKCCFTKMDAISSNKLEIFDQLVDWVRAKTLSTSST